MRKLDQVSNRQIADLWNSSAEKRFEEISTGSDRSYSEVLLPLFEDELKKLRPSSVLDAGCGLGFLSKSAAKICDTVTGVDLSGRSIEIAAARNQAANVYYHASAIEEFTPEEKFDCVVCNMVLMDCVDHRSFIEALSRMIKRRGRLFATITNPYYWPRYWGYEKKRWFSYNANIPIEANFRTSSLGQEDFITIHTHRPFASYIDALHAAGFRVNGITELSGFVKLERSVHSKYPRYIFFDAEKE